MTVIFVLVSILYFGAAIKIRHHKNAGAWRHNLIAWSLSYVGFNGLVGLLILFNGLEKSPEDLMATLTEPIESLITLLLCVVNGVFFSGFFLSLFTQPVSGR